MEAVKIEGPFRTKPTATMERFYCRGFALRPKIVCVWVHGDGDTPCWYFADALGYTEAIEAAMADVRSRYGGDWTFDAHAA